MLASPGCFPLHLRSSVSVSTRPPFTAPFPIRYSSSFPSFSPPSPPTLRLGQACPSRLLFSSRAHFDSSSVLRSSCCLVLPLTLSFHFTQLWQQPPLVSSMMSILRCMQTSFVRRCFRQGSQSYSQLDGNRIHVSPLDNEPADDENALILQAASRDDDLGVRGCVSHLSFPPPRWCKLPSEELPSPCPID